MNDVHQQLQQLRRIGDIILRIRKTIGFNTHTPRYSNQIACKAKANRDE